MLSEISPSITAKTDSPFEKAVGEELARRGLTIERQVGCGGYLVDIAIIDPQQAGKYVLGVECDGATYQSAVTARDRDRLRKEVLEGLGWRLVRVWSTDWVRDREKQVKRILVRWRLRRIQDGRIRISSRNRSACPPCDGSRPNSLSLSPSRPCRVLQLQVQLSLRSVRLVRCPLTISQQRSQSGSDSSGQGRRFASASWSLLMTSSPRRRWRLEKATACGFQILPSPSLGPQSEMRLALYCRSLKARIRLAR